MWPLASAPRMRLGATVRLKSSLGATRVLGNPTPLTFTLTRSWIQKLTKFNVNFLISVIKGHKIWRFQAFTPWLMPLQGILRTYEDQPTSLQG